MSSFSKSANTNNLSGDDEFYDFPINSLPEFMTESSMFIMTMDLCPDSTTFPFLKSKIPTTLDINTHEDFARLIEADAMFQFRPKVQKQILKNMYNFWLDNPESSQIELPIKDISHFGNQVRDLFLESESILPVRCFQHNYVELFDYLLERDGLHSMDGGRFPDYTLPYYGVVNNHIEIVRRGLEVGVSVAKDCMDQAIKKQNLEMFNLLREHKIKYTARTLELAAEMGLPEMYKYFLGVAINNNMLNKFVFESLKNKTGLEYLLHESSVNLHSNNINGEELLEECIKEAYSVDVIQMVDGYFTKTNVNGKTLINTMCQFRPGMRYISEKVIYKEDLELFMYLQSKGFLISEHLIGYAKEKHKSVKFTPGFMKKQFAEQEANLEQERMEALWDEEAREAALNEAAEREDFERQFNDGN